jgi:hypothetical protein
LLLQYLVSILLSRVLARVVLVMAAAAVVVGIKPQQDLY